MTFVVVDANLLMWNADPEFSALVQCADGNTTVLGNEADELLSNVLYVVVLSQLANVRLDCVLGWLTAECQTRGTH